ncbi:ompA family protein [Caballeronia terrestris]|uniref:OmpA family protein n=1 Tax=Caballeronia terrestris TaxID=1226301 RepID=A0A158IHY6_9BURK|nr:OmpA family protein [Caballeronia terrestris]SAL56175.1 ompA family protein [Caballeronia terrestris]
MKVIQSIYSVCAIALLVTGCSSGLDRSREEADNARAGVVVSVAKSGVEMRMLEATLFDSDETAVRPDSVAILDRTAVLLKRSTRPILIEGHTDNEGTRVYNDALSLMRAEAIANALIARGVPAARIRTKGMAYLQPIASNNTPEGRAQNRRVEIFVRSESADTLLGPKPLRLDWLPW